MHNDPIHKRSWDLEVVCVFMDRISNISNITTLLLLKVMYNTLFTWAYYSVII